MKFSILVPTSLLVAGSLLAPVALSAQAQARVHGQVKNSRGEPVADVKITISDTETSTHYDLKTDAAGRYSVVLLDSTRPYVYKLEADGYPVLQETFKAPISSNTVKDFTLPDRGAGGAPPPTPRNRAIVLYNEGAELARAGDAAGAEAKFRAALAEFPELGPAATGLAAIRLEAGDAAGALTLADQALAADPGDGTALALRYRALEKLGDKEKAAEALRALEAADPQARAAMLYNQGVDSFNAGDVETARQQFEAAVAAFEGHAKAHYMLGLTLTSAGDNAKAKPHLERFLELAPDDPDAATARELLAYQ